MHSLSTNDASLGEYKHTVSVGQYVIKITGDCFDLVRVSIFVCLLLRNLECKYQLMDNFVLIFQEAKLVLDEYFGRNEFLSGVEAGVAEANLIHSSSTASMSGTSLSTPTSAIPPSHQLSSASPFVDSGIGLNVMAAAQFGGNFNNQSSVDDDVFVIEDDGNGQLLELLFVFLIRIAISDLVSSKQTISSTSNAPQPNGLTRSRRSHFSHGETLQEAAKETNSKAQSEVQISYENERLIYFSKSPHSWALPRDWIKISELYPNLVRNKVCEYDKVNNNNNSNSSQNHNDFNSKHNTKSNSYSTNHAFRKRGVAMSQ